MNKMDIEKIKSENITHEEHMNNVLQDIEYQKMYLDAAIQEFITEGDYDLFFQSLEQVIKLDTIGKLLKELGFSLHVA